MISSKDKEKKKAFASLHCVHYAKCLSEAAKGKKEIDCYKCEKIEIVTDNYQKEIDDVIYIQ